MENKESENNRDVVAGRNEVAEALRSGRPIDCLYVASGGRSGSLGPLIAQAKNRGIPVKNTDVRKLDRMCGGTAHQGIAAAAAAKEYSSVEDIFRLAKKRGEPPFILIADGLEDPHNLGAVIRVAECAGAHGVIIPQRRSAGLTATVEKASAGALEYMPVARVTNLASALDDLKTRGVWIYAADMGGEPWCGIDYTGPMALVIGSEGSGIGPLIRKKSDFVISLPLLGKINSLNASVACGVICYEVVRQRHGVKTK